MKWIYMETPSFIARYTQEGKLEVLQEDTAKWVDKSNDSHLWHVVEEEGSSLTEKEALEVFERKKKFSKRK